MDSQDLKCKNSFCLLQSHMLKSQLDNFKFFCVLNFDKTLKLTYKDNRHQMMLHKLQVQLHHFVYIPMR